MTSLATCALTVGVCASQGGYFPPTWGWSAAVVLAAIGVWGAIASRFEISRGALLHLGAIVALLVWTSLSALWSLDRPSTVLEIERTLLLAAVLAALFLLVARDSLGAVAAGAAVGGVLICGYACATRLFPRQFGSFDPTAYRLSAPVGYWNGLGVLAAMTILMCAGIVGLPGRRGMTGVRCAAGAAVPVVAAALYFTFSRGSWAALAVGGAATLSLVPHRHRMLASWLVLAPFAAVGVAYGSSLEGLTRRNSSIADAAADGRRLALVLVLLAAGAAAAVLLLARAERHAAFDRLARAASVAVAVAAVGVAVSVVATGRVHPVGLVHRAQHSFAEQPTDRARDLNARLFSLSGSGRGRLWHVAWVGFTRHPVGGAGAGTFQRLWLRDPQANFYVHDAHSLYLETLTELGLVGLGILAVLVALPLLAAARSRGSATVAVGAGAYVAYSVHAAVDWDWELAGVTLIWLVLGGALVANAFPRAAGERAVRWPQRALALVAVPLAALALYGWAGNAASAKAQDELDGHRYEQAIADSRRAASLMRWSPDPLLTEADASLALGDRAAARAAAAAATARDRGDWEAWYDLALASSGAARVRALERATTLYPRGQQVVLARVRYGLDRSSSKGAGRVGNARR